MKSKTLDTDETKHAHTMIFSNLLIAFLIIAMPLLIILITNKKHQHNRLPPGPKKLPLIGNLHQLGGLAPHRSLRLLSREHGPLMFLQLGSVPTLVVSSAAMAREIFKTHDSVFSGRPALYAAKKMGYKCSTISFAPYGDYWRQVRKIALVELLSAKRVQSFKALREQEVASMIKSVADSSPNPINLSELTLLQATNFVLRVVFRMKGSDYGENNAKSEFDEIFHETQHLLGMVNIADYFPWMGWFNKFNGVDARLDKNLRDLDRFYDRAIQKHRECPHRSGPDEHEDLVDVLLRIQADPKQDTGLTDDQIKAVLTDMFVAGTDTSSATLVWIMTLLIKNPTVMSKAQEEVRRLVQGKGMVEESDLPKLDYLKMIIKETFRLQQPVPLLIPRETTETCTVGGYEIPAKTRVFFNATAISMDPQLWEDPEEFKPERFLNSSIDFRGQHFELIPFGAGRRSCPGTNFAVLIIELVLANLLFSFNWRLPDGMNAEDIDMEETIGIAVHKKTPLCLVASPYVHI
ncbi:cytochrome P450 71A9 [Daucus carota subsp. sativus]|uniref:cytochrome P450 71A9 n=1 Tax=Daucus carota subsp. sativus TaxID=79200 RepID=UPI0007F0345E|nr:PREDICTED: cytochrome P450 71A9-like [Daucus carota subsp. sativus]